MRRVFYGVEEPLELHLSILEGVQARYSTPFFDNLKNYAKRPIGNLPRAADRARQIRVPLRLDPGHGRVLRHQSVSRRKQRHDRRPRQHAGADRQHQESAGRRGARVRRGSRLLRHQWHVDQQQDGGAGARRARRYRHRRPQLPQVASLRNGAWRRPAALCRSVPAHAIFDVRRGAAEHDQEGAARPARGRPARPRSHARSDELHVRRAHVQHAPRDGGMPRHQAGPHLPLGRGMVRLCALVAVPAAAHRDGRGGGARGLAERPGLRQSLREAAG